MSEPKVLNAPDRIYLQAGDLIDDVLFGEMAEVTWCQDPVGDHDVPYVRADLHAALEAEVERLQAVRRALVRDNRDKTNTIRELQARVRGLEEALRRCIGSLGAASSAAHPDVEFAKAALATVSAKTAPWTPVDFGSAEEHAQRAGRPSTRKETTVSEAPSFTKGELDWYDRNSDSIVGEFAREIKRLQARVEELQEELHATDMARLRTDGPHS